MEQQNLNGYTRFERARIIGARALQLAMGAPPLVKTETQDPFEIAKQELVEDVVPIAVRRNN